MNRHEALDIPKGGPVSAADTDLYLAMLTDVNVLLSGPADAALAIARRIHQESGWRYGPFIVVDCRVPSTLERRVADAFGARGSRDSTLRLVQAGTAFFHEIACMPAELQRRLDDQLAERHRSGRSRRRVVASSSESLVQRVRDGTFDERLFYRLNMIHLVVPPKAG